MTVTPLPGVDRGNLLQALQKIKEVVGNLYRSDRSDAPQKLVTYLLWAADTARTLHGQVHPQDIDRLVFTRGHAQLLAGVDSLSLPSMEPVTYTLLSLELSQRVEAFTDAVTALQQQIDRWAGPGGFIVCDTSVYIHNPDPFEDLDFQALLNDHGPDPVHLLVPMVVLDELERLKESGKEHTRWRSRHALAVLDRVCRHRGAGTLREEDFSTLGTDVLPRPRVTAEIVLDPRGHIRLPIDDDEIVDRALALEPLAGRPITLVTYDTNQSTRARMAGLDVIKHDMPPEDPKPEKAPAQRRQRRSNAPAATQDAPA